MGRNSKLIASLCAGTMLFTAPCSHAANHGMDAEVLSQIPKKLQAIIDRGKSSGMVTLVARNGEIASIDAVGWRYMAKKEPLETTDVFWAASITKPFVAVAIMIMVDKGHLQLDDLVEKHIPEFKGQKVKAPKGLQPAKNRLTIRNLLNHLDALPVTRATRSAKTIKGRALASGKSTLMWEPGTKWKYGGEGLHVGAYLVEKYSGMPYAKFLKTRILEPLGMKNTYFTIKNVPKSRSVPTHRKLKNGKWESFERGDFGGGRGGPYFAVDGGFFSTVEDLFCWCQMLLNGGEFDGVRYLSENSVRELTRKQTGDVKLPDTAPETFMPLPFKRPLSHRALLPRSPKGASEKAAPGGRLPGLIPVRRLFISCCRM